MSLALFLVVAAIIFFVVMVSVGRSRLQFSDATELHPVDVEAFRNLADPRESEYLRSHLPPPEFRRVQRMRLRATAAYVQAVGRNAVVLIRIGQLASNSDQPEMLEAARKLIDQALLLRRNAGLAMLRIYLALLLPKAGFAAGAILEGYERLSGSAMLVGRLRNPGAAVRIRASVRWFPRHALPTIRLNAGHPSYVAEHIAVTSGITAVILRTCFPAGQ